MNLLQLDTPVVLIDAILPKAQQREYQAKCRDPFHVSKLDTSIMSLFHNGPRSGSEHKATGVSPWAVL